MFIRAVNASAFSKEKITTAWAASEGGLGGVLHAARLPITGIVVGGISATLLSMLAATSGTQGRWPHWYLAPTLFRAMAVVQAAKFAVAPHSPPGAYFAVATQCTVAACLHTFLPWHRLAAFLTGFLSVVLSAVQKVLILWLLFGTALAIAIDQFVATTPAAVLPWLADSPTVTVISVFLGTYCAAGLSVGFFSASLPSTLKRRSESLPTLNALTTTISAPRKWRLAFVFFCFAAGAFVLQWMAFGAAEALQALLRTTLLILVWHMVLAPAISLIGRRWLSSQLNSQQQFVTNAVAQMEAVPLWAATAWQHRHNRPGNALLNAGSYFLLFALSHADSHP